VNRLTSLRESPPRLRPIHDGGFSAPVLRSVPDVQDFNNFFGQTVHHDVRRAHEFARSCDLSGSTKAGKGRELLNPLDNRFSDLLSCCRVVFLDVLNRFFKLPSRLGGPTNEPHE
jgi:hypothetical protein